MNEFQLIDHFFKRQTATEGVMLGIGDDCALLAVPQGHQLAVSIDTLVEGVHFPQEDNPEWIAERALAVTVSDLAAMGAKPLWFTLALTLPDANAHWLTGFSAGLFKAAQRYACQLVGGDTTRGPLTISIQVHGSVPIGQALKRSGAQQGDLIAVTGDLGSGAAGLACIQGRFTPEEPARQVLVDHYYRPLAQVEQGIALRGLANSAIDVSDGLLADLGHICDQSGVGAKVELERIPRHGALRQLEPEQQNRWCLSGGDDYQLCVTAPLGACQALEDLGCQVIGEIVSGKGVQCVSNGQIFDSDTAGYQHF